ncbi:RHS repeat-associated core domain-containing protein [Delftia acidovorans]
MSLTDQAGLGRKAGPLDPWGNVLQEYNPQGIHYAIRLPGQHHDRETGLYYNRHRYYDPVVGSYINQDPIGLAGGFNKSLYTAKPNIFIDPLGLEAKVVGHLAGGPVGRLTNPNSYHLAIQLNPDDQNCDLGGTKTLGGQPSGSFANGNLTSAPNYPGDAKGIVYEQTIATSEGMTDCDFLKKLKKSSESYCNCLLYSKPNVSLIPVMQDGQMDNGKYNSNSYVAGVIKDAGATLPTLQTNGEWQAPGYGNPMPIENYIAPIGTVQIGPK